MAEGSFLEVYQKLYEAPDPAQALQAALVSGHLLPGSQHDVTEGCCLHAQLHSQGCRREEFPCWHTLGKSWTAGQSPAWQYCQHENRGVT